MHRYIYLGFGVRLGRDIRPVGGGVRKWEIWFQ
jgi:hypothetical protein